jgi:hypothetical protein
MKSATDQNGKRLTASVHPVTSKSGQHGWAARVWFGHYQATDVRWYIYKTKDGARKACISDTYQNSDLIAHANEDWNVKTH